MSLQAAPAARRRCGRCGDSSGWILSPGDIRVPAPGRDLRPGMHKTGAHFEGQGESPGCGGAARAGGHAHRRPASAGGEEAGGFVLSFSRLREEIASRQRTKNASRNDIILVVIPPVRTTRRQSRTCCGDGGLLQPLLLGEWSEIVIGLLQRLLLGETRVFFTSCGDLRLAKPS